MWPRLKFINFNRLAQYNVIIESARAFDVSQAKEKLRFEKIINNVVLFGNGRKKT